MPKPSDQSPSQRLSLTTSIQNTTVPAITPPSTVGEPLSGIGPVSIDELNGLELAKVISERFALGGPHAEYQRFYSSTFVQTNRNAFEFIQDAVEGTGGFEDGQYLDPHFREVTRVDQSSGGYTSASQTSQKFHMRKKLTDYDNFARVVRDTYWGYIVQSKDEIRRQTSVTELQDFWADADINGTDIVDFLAQPQVQARQYGHALIALDRPALGGAGRVLNERENENPDNRPYACSIPTRNVVDWEFDEDGRLEAVAYLIPYDNVSRYQVGDEDTFPIRIWTTNTWSTWYPAKDDKGQVTYSLDASRSGTHKVGEVPVVILYNDAMPPKGHLFGKSEMKEVCLIGKTVFNIDSEIREVERNNAFPIFTVPMKNPNSIKSLTVSSQGAMGYDGTSGQPSYVSADLSVLVRLQERRDKKVEQAYGMAQLGIVSGQVKTTSGFHTQAEFDKSNRRIGRNAAALEDVEMKIARLFCLWIGKTPEEVRTGGLFTVTYPRNFGLRDVEAMITQSTELIALGLGLEANTLFLRDLIETKYPRMPVDDVLKLAKKSAIEIQSALAAGVGVGAGQSGQPGPPGQPGKPGRPPIGGTPPPGLPSGKEVPGQPGAKGMENGSISVIQQNQNRVRQILLRAGVNVKGSM